MLRRWLLAIALLPGTVIVLVPLCILWICDRLRHPIELAGRGTVIFWVALIFAISGSGLGFWTALLFIRFGDGTAAPWDPPTRFVGRRPYRDVRKPMIIGAFALRTPPPYNPHAMEQLTHENIPAVLDELGARILILRDSL